jgi:hypothetical protein
MTAGFRRGRIAPPPLAGEAGGGIDPTGAGPLSIGARRPPTPTLPRKRGRETRDDARVA